MHSLGLDRIMLDFLISVILLLWNRLRMSDKFFNFFSSFISIFLDFETCTIYLPGEVLQFYTRYYMYLSPYLHRISSPENTPIFFLYEIIFDATSRIINSGMIYEEVFPSKRTLRRISYFSFLIITNAADGDINAHYKRL